MFAFGLFPELPRRNLLVLVVLMPS